MSEFQLIKEKEWMLHLAKEIASVKIPEPWKRLISRGSQTLSRRATKVAMFEERRNFKIFMKRALEK